jgi:hypothetical protein
VGKLEGKRPIERPRLRWKDNIKVDLKEVGCGDVVWNERWLLLVDAVMNLRVP